jgi:hypothetical protein
LLYKQQVKIGQIICFTYSRGETNTLLLGYQTAGEKWSHYLLYKQQVKIGHNICFTDSRSVGPCFVQNGHIICFTNGR